MAIKHPDESLRIKTKLAHRASRCEQSTNNTRAQAQAHNKGNEKMNDQVYIITADGGNLAVCRYYQDARETAQYWRTRKGLRNVRIQMRTIY